MSGAPVQVGIYGSGHFGYALLRHLEPKAGAQIELRGYDREACVRDVLHAERRHPFFEAPNPLSRDVRIVDDVEALLDDLDLLVLAVTSQSTRDVAGGLRAVAWSKPLSIVNSAKALDAQTGRRLSEIVFEALAHPPQPMRYGMIAGGTIADDLLRQDPLGVTLASEDPALLRLAKPIFSSRAMWVQTSTDLIGVEFAGAFKNVISICAGLVHGLGLSYGAETHLISRMASEVAAFCVSRCGALAETFSIGSQCWGSDMWMSCTGNTRNRALGELIGGGMSLEEATAEMARQRKTVEGVQTLRALRPILAKFPDDLPLIGAADRVVLGNAPPQTLIETLMQDDEELQRVGS